MPFCFSAVSLQLHLKALLEVIGPSAFVNEMTAVLFLETVMEQSGSLVFKLRHESAIQDQLCTNCEDYRKLNCAEQKLLKTVSFL